MVALLAVEPLRELGEWVAARGKHLGFEVDVRRDMGEACSRLGEREFHYVAGCLDRGEAPSLPQERGATLIPFLRIDGSQDDYRLRWDLLLEALRNRHLSQPSRFDSLRLWIDRRFEEKMERRHRELIESLDPIFENLNRRDPSVRLHSFRVGLYAARIGEALGLVPMEVMLLRIGGWVHDVGKIRIRTRTLRKAGLLEPEEIRSMRRHPVWGSDIMRRHGVEEEIDCMVRHHHERFDGTGYPEHIREEGISHLARILAVADAYDAVTSDRPYRRAAGHRDAVHELLAHAGTQFDPAVVQGFLRARLDRLLPRR